MPEPQTRTILSLALAVGAAGIVLVGGTIVLILALGALLRAYGFGIMLLVAVGALLLFGAAYDVRRKRRKPGDSTKPEP